MSASVNEIGAESRHRSALSIRPLVVVAYGCVVLALVVHFVLYLRYALTAVQFPFELDYGEGIVWQQALLIPGDRMYGDITRFPYTVFHYPPLYHLIVHSISALGFDTLAAGRGISVLCTLLIGGAVAVLTYDATGGLYGRAARLIGSAISGFTVFCYWPVVCWSPMMRVDMLAIMLSLLGVWLSVRSIQRPSLLYLAVISFVLAVYTKQTSIAAPLAVLLVSFQADRRHTIKAYGLGLVVGLVGLLALTWSTDGGFIRHLLFYNLNRFSPEAAVSAVVEEWPHAVFLAFALGGLVIGLRRLSPGTGESLASRVSQNQSTRLLAVLIVYVFSATGMLVTLGKSGAKLNYMIEWMCLWSVFIGVCLTSAMDRFIIRDRRAVTVNERAALFGLLMPIALLVQVIVLPATRDYSGGDAARNTELGALVDKIRNARLPVLSDDMVLLLKAGKQVPWEPAIFAELASTGRWDEQLIREMIAAKAFAFIITRGQAGEEIYDSRYTPPVDMAIRRAYPRTEDIGGRTLHFPAG